VAVISGRGAVVAVRRAGEEPFTALDGRRSGSGRRNCSGTPDVTRVYLVLSPDDRDDFRTRFGHLIAFVNLELVDGGTERFDSVANALARIPATADWSRPRRRSPLATPELIDAVVRGGCRTWGGAAGAGRWRTRSSGRDGDETASRRRCANRAVAGPDAAGLPPRLAHGGVCPVGGVRRSDHDDAQLIEATGRRVVVVPGSPTNFKITTKDDLDLAAAVLQARATLPAAKPAARFDDEAKW